MGKKLSDTEVRLKKLKKLYGYEIAEHNQKAVQKLTTPEELLESLALIHLERQIQDSVTEYLETVGASKESFTSVYSGLGFIQAFLHERFEGIEDADKTFAETFSRAWIESIEGKRNE